MTVIKKIIDERLNDDQLSDCPLTLADLKTIAATFSRILRGTQHDRIKYHQNIVDELDKSDVILPSHMHIMDKEMEEKVKKLEQGNDE